MESESVRDIYAVTGSESVQDIAESIRAKAGVIIEATVEADITEALDQIENAVGRMRAIL